MKKRGFSLTEVMVAIAMVALISIPIVNSLKQSKTQTKKIGKKFLAIQLAQSIFEYNELYFSNDTVKLSDVLSGSNQKEYASVSDLLSDLDFKFSSEMIKSIKQNYKDFKIICKYSKDTTSGHLEYKDRFMKIEVIIFWKEVGKDKKITYSGEIVKG